MEWKKNLRENFQDKKIFYENEISKVEKIYEGKIQWLSDLRIKKEKLERWKNLLDTLSCLVNKRFLKANEIHELINTWKDISPEVDNIKNINNEIKNIQNSLLFLKDFSEWIADILWENIPSDIISKNLNIINKELSKLNIEIDKKERLEKEKNLLNQKYRQYISYINKYLDRSKNINSDYTDKLIEWDLVYQYAEKKWIIDILEKMKSRKLTYEEYENILIEINPIYAYITHIINISESNTEKEKYYRLLASIEKWTISEKDKSNLENKSNERLYHKNNWETTLSSTEKKEDLSNKEWINKEWNELEILIKKIPNKTDWNSNLTPKEKQEKISQILLETEGEDNLRLLAEALIKQGWKPIVDKHNKFSFLREELHNKKIELETWWSFTNENDYENFKLKNDHNSEEALHIIDSGNTSFIISHLKYFKNLNEEVLNKLAPDIKNHHQLLQNYNSFWIEINKFLSILLDNELNWDKIKTFLSKRNDLNWDLACKLAKFDLKYLKELIENWWFLKLDSKTASIIMETGENWKTFVMSQPYYFENLNLAKKTIEEQIEKLIKKSEYEAVIDILKNNQWIDHQKFAVMLAKNDRMNKYRETWFETIACHINKIEWLEHNEIANILVKKWMPWIMCLCNNLGNFKWLNEEIAEVFIKKGLWEQVINNIKSFEWEYHNNIIHKLIKKKLWKYITWNINNFKWINQLEIAKKLIETGQWLYVTPAKFHWLDYEVFEYLLENCTGNMRWNMAKNIRGFEWEYHKDIANKFIEIGKWKFVVQYLKRFKWLDNTYKINLANIVLDSGDYEYVEKYIENFEFNEETEKKILDRLKNIR